MKSHKDIIVVGSVAFDDIETIKGKRKKLVGGSGTYFSLAASIFTNVHLVGVVGDNFPSSYFDMFHSKSISTKYLTRKPGKTFHWGGVYSNDFSSRKTLFTELGVFEKFNPQIEHNNIEEPILFLANIQPKLQKQIIQQVKNPSLIVLDTMNLWIDNNPEELIDVIKDCNILLINDEEILQLTKKDNLLEGGTELLKLGLNCVIIKKGGDGALIISKDIEENIPAVPGIDMYDPTGAGDSFAGGFLGYIASNKTWNIKDAVITGSALASYTVAAFGIEGIKNLELKNVQKRIILINELMKGK